MSESSIFQKEEELLEFGARFLAEYGPEVSNGENTAETAVCKEDRARYYDAFQQLFTNYKKLVQQTARLIRLSDRTQLRLDTVNKSLRESQLQLERRNQFIRGIFNRYMSDEVVESILETPEGLQMGGEKKQVTVVMSDLRGFTAISETLPPETVVTIINQYLEKMTEIIFKYKGTISNFMGDGIMILFGAPIGREDDAQRAVACALEMQQAMPEINIRNESQGYPTLNMGVGIHTGMVVAGNIGSQKRSQYTVMGRAVNLAARIESYSVGGQVLISEHTRQACSVPLRIDNTMEVTPKGIEHTLTLYQVGGIGGAYPVYLGEAKAVEYRHVSGQLPVQFAILAGKHAGSMDYSGEFSGLSPSGAKLKTAVPLEPFSNLKLTLQWEQETIHGIFAKVVGGETEDNPEAELVFTFVPPKAHSLFQTLLEEEGWKEGSAEEPPREVSVDLCATVELSAGTSGNDREARVSFRRISSKTVTIPIQMENGNRIKASVGDFSLDGMLLKMGRNKVPAMGATGSLELPFHGRNHPFLFEVVHQYQRGVGIRIKSDQKIYAMALLDGALGDFFETVA
ncbi:MAG: adenylate/guanylate cyclase domain-containing protein [Magnetococcales bacterium]|nr:adenylate/guanylate cyclase domain-containing protein [Magnetococcales bacterium]